MHQQKISRASPGLRAFDSTRFNSLNTIIYHCMIAYWMHFNILVRRCVQVTRSCLQPPAPPHMCQPSLAIMACWEKWLQKTNSKWLQYDTLAMALRVPLAKALACLIEISQNLVPPLTPTLGKAPPTHHSSPHAAIAHWRATR